MSLLFFRNRSLSENFGELIKNFDGPEHKHDYYAIGEDYIERILKVVARLLLEKESTDEERVRCLKVLKLTNPNVQLDREINAALKVVFRCF